MHDCMHDVPWMHTRTDVIWKRIHCDKVIIGIQPDRIFHDPSIGISEVRKLGGSADLRATLRKEKFFQFLIHHLPARFRFLSAAQVCCQQTCIDAHKGVWNVLRKIKQTHWKPCPSLCRVPWNNGLIDIMYLLLFYNMWSPGFTYAGARWSIDLLTKCRLK